MRKRKRKTRADNLLTTMGEWLSQSRDVAIEMADIKKEIAEKTYYRGESMAYQRALVRLKEIEKEQPR